MDEERRYLGLAVGLEEMWSRKGLHEAIRDNLRTPLRKFALFIRWAAVICSGDPTIKLVFSWKFPTGLLTEECALG